MARKREEGGKAPECTRQTHTVKGPTDRGGTVSDGGGDAQARQRRGSDEVSKRGVASAGKKPEPRAQEAHSSAQPAATSKRMRV
jgi:hypothetical protein